MDSFQFGKIPGDLSWLRPPVDHNIDASGLMIQAGALTDWFIDPAGSVAIANAPVALFTPPAGDFVLQARVAVAFGRVGRGVGRVQLVARHGLFGVAASADDERGNDEVGAQTGSGPRGATRS